MSLMVVYGPTVGALHNYQHHVEVYLRYMILRLYPEYGIMILVILEAPTVVLLEAPLLSSSLSAPRLHQEGIRIDGDGAPPQHAIEGLRECRPQAAYTYTYIYIYIFIFYIYTYIHTYM